MSQFGQVSPSFSTGSPMFWELPGQSRRVGGSPLEHGALNVLKEAGVSFPSGRQMGIKCA